MKLHTLQALRAVAALLIVCVHISAPYGIETRYVDGPHLTGWMHVPGLAGVDLFFVISGAIMTITMWDRFAKPGVRGEFLYRRITRVYPVYLIVTALILVYFLAHGAVNSHSAHRPEILPSFLILPQRGDPLLAVGWTLVYEMYFYLAFTVALLFRRRWLPWLAGGWAAATVLLELVLTVRGSAYLTVISNPINVEFVFGIGVGYLVMNRRLAAPGALLAGAGVTVVGLLAYAAATGDDGFPSEWFRVFAVGLAFAVFVYAAIGMELTRSVHVPRLLERVGDASYSLYLWHIPVLSVLGLTVARLVPGSPVPHALGVVAMLGITLAAALWLYELLERPLLRFFRTRRFRASTTLRSA